MIVRLTVLFVAGCALVAVLGIAAATPALSEREYSDFHACIASIPHPPLPAALLTRDTATQERALALLGAEDACARVSGIDGSGRERPLEWLHALRPGASGSDGVAEVFARCTQARRSSRGVVAQIGTAVDCYRASGGLTATQFELATGYNPQYDFFTEHVKNTPVLSKRRFPRTMLHERDGTWWNRSCS